MLKQHARISRVQLMPLPRLQTTRRPHFTSRRWWRIARLMLRFLLLVKCGRRVVCRRGSRVQLMPLLRPQTTRPLVSIRTRWRVARLMLRAGVGRV